MAFYSTYSVATGYRSISRPNCAIDFEHAYVATGSNPHVC
jgi:hypothetical protein